MPQQADIDNTDPLWAKILQLLYSRGLGGEEPGTEPWTYREKTADTIINELGARDENVEDSLQYMADIGLIEERESTSSNDTKYAYGLTQKGFEVAHERELRNQQLHTNVLLTVLTGVLALGAIFQTLMAMLTADLPTMVITPTIALFAFLIGAIWRTVSDWAGIRLRYRG